MQGKFLIKNLEYQTPELSCPIGWDWLKLDKELNIMFSKVLENVKNKVQFSSVAQSCLTLCKSMNCSTPGLPVHHQLPESTQTHVHQVDDAIQSPHPLSSPSPPALNLSQHQGLFQ